MSSENNTTTSGLAGIIGTLKTNPKALAAAGAVVALVLFLVLKSGDEGVNQTKVAAISIGQTVTIQNPNIGNTILLAAPGPVAIDDSDSDKNDSIICRNVASGTTARVEEETTVNYIPFVKLTISDGDCAGKTGWVPKVNIK